MIAFSINKGGTHGSTKNREGAHAKRVIFGIMIALSINKGA